jgi:YggT family protein
MFPGSNVLVTLISIFILVVIIRGILSWFPGMLYTDVGRLIVTATEWFLAPIRRVIPPIGGLDVSFLVAILILYALQAFLTSGNIVFTLLQVVGYALGFLVILLLIRVLFGFFRMDPWHPIVQMINSVTDPFARPFRTWLPNRRGQFDWAPVAAFVVLLAVWYFVTRLQTFAFF